MGIGAGTVVVAMGQILISDAVGVLGIVDHALAPRTLGFLCLMVGALTMVTGLWVRFQRSRATRGVERRAADDL